MGREMVDWDEYRGNDQREQEVSKRRSKIGEDYICRESERNTRHLLSTADKQKMGEDERCEERWGWWKGTRRHRVAILCHPLMSHLHRDDEYRRGSFTSMRNVRDSERYLSMVLTVASSLVILRSSSLVLICLINNNDVDADLSYITTWERGVWKGRLVFDTISRRETQRHLGKKRKKNQLK